MIYIITNNGSYYNTCTSLVGCRQSLKEHTKGGWNRVQDTKVIVLNTESLEISEIIDGMVFMEGYPICLECGSVLNKNGNSDWREHSRTCSSVERPF